MKIILILLDSNIDDPLQMHHAAIDAANPGAVANQRTSDKDINGMLQMEILEKLKHDTGGVVHDPQLLAEHIAHYQRLQRSVSMAESPMAAHAAAAAELLKREAFLSLKPKMDFYNFASLQEQQYLAAAQGQTRMTAQSPPRQSHSPSGSEDGGSISPNRAPSTGGQWTYEEQFKQVRFYCTHTDVSYTP